MADVPRDPRQLARDILSGKVKIEDLARERQRQGGGAPPPAGGNMPARIPLPRQAPPPPPRPAPPRQQKPRPAPPPQPRQAPRPPAQRQMPRPPPPEPVNVEGPTHTIAEPCTDIPLTPIEQATANRKERRVVTLHDLIKSPRAIRQGIILAEVLGKPVSMRDQNP